MKKTIIILLLFCCIPAIAQFKYYAFSGGGGVRYGENLISNNSFETYSGTQDDGTTDTFTGWTNSVATGGTVESVTASRTGTSALMITRVTATSSIRKVANVIAGEQYVYSFYVKGDGVTSGAFAIFDLTHTTFIKNTTSTEIVSTSYEYYSYTVTIPEGCSQIIVYFWNPIANNAYAFFDDAEFVPYTTVNDTLGAGNWNSDITVGDIFIPKNYGGRDNWLGEDDFVNGDKFTFNIYNNWVDQVDCNGSYLRTHARIFGLENTSHTLTIKNQDGDKIVFDALINYRPKAGR